MFFIGVFGIENKDKEIMVLDNLNIPKVILIAKEDWSNYESKYFFAKIYD